MMKRLGAAVLLLFITACGGGERGGAGGETIVVGLRADLGGFNPVTNSDQYTGELINYALFTPLVQYDSSLAVKPHLADSWEMQGDSGVVFRLRRDVKWNDGRAVTAEDVKFTFDLAKDSSTASLLGSAFLANVASAEAVDSFTVHFRFVRPHAQALEDFWWAPLPKHLLENVAPSELRNAPFNRQPVGSGPYKVVERRANERIVLERNPDYPEGLGGPPPAQRIVLRVIPEPSTMLTELTTGGVHVDIPVTPDQTETIEKNQNLKLFAFPGRSLWYIGWNNSREPFTDPNVRRALALGINRQEVIDALLFGQGEIATSTVPPWHPLYPENVRPLPFDPEEAGRLLDAAGWRDSNGDGIRDKNGRPLRFEMMSSDATLNRSVVEQLQAQYRRIGVQVVPRTLEFQTMLAQHKARDFDAVFSSWVLDNFQMASAPMALFHSSIARTPLSTNRSAVQIPALDRLIDRAATTTDEQQLRGIWSEMTQLLQREQPITFLYWLNELAGTQRTMEGVEMAPPGEFMTIGKWRLNR